MSTAWHCDRQGCDAWTRAGHRHGFLEVDQGDGDVLHFCGWDCALRYGATKAPLEVIGND